MRTMNMRGALFLVAVLISGALHAQAYTLPQAVKHTLRTNPQMLALKHELKSREWEVKQAKSGYLPRLSISAGVGQETRNAPATGSEEVDFDRQELGIQARQTVFDGFATSAEVKRQKARVESASYEYQSTAENLALRTAEVYLNVLRHSKLVDLARESLWEHQNIFDQMKLRSDTGVGSKADLDQIGARLALANANMIVAQNNLADAQSNFYRQVGIYPNLENIQEPSSTTDLPANREVALAGASENHPTLLAAGADVKAAEAQYKASESNYWPTVQLEADKRWDENVGGIEGKDEDFIVALRMTYSLYNGGSDKARRRQTAYLMEESKDVRNNARRQVVESLNLSWNAYEALTSQMKFLNQHVDAADATKKAYGKQFNIGRRTLLDLLNAETEFLEARRAKINAEYDRLYAKYRIFNASGSLVTSLGIDSESIN